METENASRKKKEWINKIEQPSSKIVFLELCQEVNDLIFAAFGSIQWSGELVRCWQLAVIIPAVRGWQGEEKREQTKGPSLYRGEHQDKGPEEEQVEEEEGETRKKSKVTSWPWQVWASSLIPYCLNRTGFFWFLSSSFFSLIVKWHISWFITSALLLFQFNFTE